MEDLSGVGIHKLDFTLNKRGDLISFEGPLLSYFFGDNGKNYLMYWVDCDAEVNRWLLFEITLIDLFDYFNKTKSLKELIKVSKELLYFIDIDNDVLFKKIIAVNKTDVPKNYLPEEESFFEEYESTEYGILLKEELSEIFSKYDTHNIKSKLRKFQHHLNDIDFITILHDRKIHNSMWAINDLRSSYLPLLILDEHWSGQRNGIKYLIMKHQNAYMDPIEYDFYFHELRNLLVHHFNTTEYVQRSSFFKENNTESTLKFLFNVTIEIASRNPSKFHQHLKLWKSSLNENLNTISRELDSRLEKIILH